MTRLRVFGLLHLALAVSAPDALAHAAERGSRGGMRGAVVGGMVGGSEGAATGAKIGVVTGRPVPPSIGKRKREPIPGDR